MERLKAEAEKVGFPIMLKAVLGGGGKGNTAHVLLHTPTPVFAFAQAVFSTRYMHAVCP